MPMAEKDLDQSVLDSVPVPGADAARSDEAPKEDLLAKERAKFKELLAKQKGEVVERVKPEKKPKAAAAPVVIEEEDSDERAQALAEVNFEEKGAEEAKREEPATNGDPELERIKAKLLLAGNPKKAIESLSESELGEWWKRQEQRERDASIALQRASEAEKKLAAYSETADDSEPNGVPADDSDLAAVRKDLSDQFGEEEGAALHKALLKAISPIKEENARIRQVISDARDRGVKMTVEKNRARLAEKLPFLRDNEEAWSILRDRVVQTFEKEPSKYSSPEEAFDSVATALYGHVEKSAPVERDMAKEKARIAASSVTPPSDSKRDRVYSSRDAHKQAFKHLLKNPGDVEGAKRSYMNMKIQ